MAMEMFLRMDGITGASSNYAHKGWADIHSWQWEMSRSRKATNDGPRETLNMNRISIVKPVGIDSPMMMKFLAERTVVEKAQISVIPAVGRREKQQKYIEIVLHNVLIQSIDTGADVEQVKSRETVVLVFGKVEYEYFHTAGTEAGAAPSSTETQSFKWDLSNKPGN
jgi:type VI secretion system secreted protein Hcp